MIITFKYRVKDATTRKHLDRYAIAANQVWNFCVATQREAQSRWKAGRKVCWPTHFNLTKLTTGCSAELGIHSDTINGICAQFVVSRDTNGKCPKFRASFGPKRAKGFVPFVPRAVKLNGAHLTYLKRKFYFWKSREIDGVFKCGAFVQDARGRWYVTFRCDVAENLSTGKGSIGIDLGLKALATCSNGEVVPALHHYRRYESALKIAQRAGNKNRVRAIHAKIANMRHHQHHVWSSRIARDNEIIAVGNLSSIKLAKTRMAKSVMDAGWSQLRSMLAYKARRHRAYFVEVDERWTTQTCSECGALPPERPKGIAGLGIRHWDCSACGASHDRDVNAARNILRVGAERRPPVVGISTSREDVNLAVQLSVK